jgi:tRNA pseudouridine38-40 synthase
LKIFISQRASFFLLNTFLRIFGRKKFILRNFRLIIQYDGTNYAGWQIQNNAVTVQQRISEAVKTILKEDVNIIGAGRTDTGVHALGQTANFRCEGNPDLYKFKYQLNSVLPQDISIISAEECGYEFHSRFDARKRSYIYLISGFKSPFLNRYSWFVFRNLDIKKLNDISREFLGEKDFSAFCRTATETVNKICEVYSIAWREVKGLLIFYIEADRFLHGMVRTIVGTLIKALDSPSPRDYIQNVFMKKNRMEAGEAVPPHGLFLYKVKYEN